MTPEEQAKAIVERCKIDPEFRKILQKAFVESNFISKWIKPIRK